MKETRTGPLLVFALALLVVGAASWRVWVAAGRVLPVVPWAGCLGLVAMVVALLVLGWPIRRWQRGQQPQLDPLRAARVVVLAKAAQWVGAGLTGCYLALALSVVDTLDISARRSGAIRAVAAGVLTVLVWVVGALVERWCRLNAGDPPDPGAAVGSQ